MAFNYIPGGVVLHYNINNFSYNFNEKLYDRITKKGRLLNKEVRFYAASLLLVNKLTVFNLIFFQGDIIFTQK